MPRWIEEQDDWHHALCATITILENKNSYPGVPDADAQKHGRSRQKDTVHGYRLRNHTSVRQEVL